MPIRISYKYENVHVTVPAAQTAQKMAPGTGTRAPQMDQRLLTNTWPKQCTIISIKQTLAKTKKQYIST